MYEIKVFYIVIIFIVISRYAISTYFTVIIFYYQKQKYILVW